MSRKSFLSLNKIFLRGLLRPLPFSSAKTQSFLAKQRVKRFYGSLTEQQWKNLFSSSFSRNKPFISILEGRLDVVITRSHFTTSILQARQLILHKKVFVNHLLVTSPSFILSPSDVITFHPSVFPFLKKNLKRFIRVAQEIRRLKLRPLFYLTLIPFHLEVNFKRLFISYLFDSKLILHHLPHDVYHALSNSLGTLSSRWR